jgi:hypothetical protein
MASEERGTPEGEEFFWTRLTHDRSVPEHVEDPFSVFFVQVKSDTETGRRMLHHPLEVLREKVPEMGIGEGPDVRAQVLRLNAEVPANPVRRSEVWIVYPGSTNLVAIQYKEPPPEKAQA